MKKKTLAGLLSAMLLFLPILCGAQAETREGVIVREGEQETIEETLFETLRGFSFWYASEWLDAYYDEKDDIDGVVVESLYSDDYMVLTMISEWEAREYTGELNGDIAVLSAESRVQTDAYRELKDGQYHFLTLIAEDGLYFRASGRYSAEAAEGNARLFQRVLDSVSFPTDCLIRPMWGTKHEEGREQVLLKALEPVTAVKLLRFEWNDETVTWNESADLGSLSARQTVSVMMEFIEETPDNGIMYTDGAGITHVFALQTDNVEGGLFFWEVTE